LLSNNIDSHFYYSCTVIVQGGGGAKKMVLKELSFIWKYSQGDFY